ncbi:hypothetical protein T440DRAFT_256655 [Plenodomus tracheiphilus IPT5]|uniref:Uncharacterized protein n=1 Tax=Plenodomus tracheiphilus IPT5 TaxID=1408161 RepID=A0A6A7ASL1_9PLEO|nr:hypothetical protein T440DRAFT_256655 [Plenodomus tracheiphilus IPT5]
MCGDVLRPRVWVVGAARWPERREKREVTRPSRTWSSHQRKESPRTSHMPVLAGTDQLGPESGECNARGRSRHRVLLLWHREFSGASACSRAFGQDSSFESSVLRVWPRNAALTSPPVETSSGYRDWSGACYALELSAPRKLGIKRWTRYGGLKALKTRSRPPTSLLW